MSDKKINVKFNLQKTEFNNNINSMNKQIKLCEQQIKTAGASMGQYANKIVNLKQKQTALSTAIKSAETNIKSYQTKIKETTTTMNYNARKVEELKQKKTELNRSYKESVKKLGEEANETKQLKEQLNQVSNEYKEYTERVKSNNNAINSATMKMEQQKTKLAGLRTQMVANNTAILENSNKMLNWAQNLDNATKRLSTISSVTGTLGNSLLTISAPLLAFGTYAVKVGAQFEQSMAQVQATSSASGQQLNTLTNKAKALGEEIRGASASDVADSFNYLALAGYNVNQMLAAIEPNVKASIAFNADMATTADQTTDSLSALGLAAEDTSQYLDKVAQASRRSNTTGNMLMEAYIGCGGMFRDFNTPLAESAALLGVLANRGIKGSEAGSAMNSILVNLMGTTSRTNAAMLQLGVSAYDSEGNFRGVERTLKDCAKAMTHMNDEQKDVIAAGLGGKTQMDTFKALLAGISNEYDGLKDSIENSDGALEEMYTTMSNTTKGSLEEFKSKAEALGITFSKNILPFINDLLDKCKELVDWFGSLDEGTQKAIIKFGLITAATGGALKAVSGITRGLSSLTGVFSKLTKGIGTAQVASQTATATATTLGNVATTTGAEVASSAKSVGLLTKALKFLKSPAGLAISAVAMVGKAIWDMEKECADSARELNSLGDSYDDFSGRIKSNATIWSQVFGTEYTIKFSDKYKESMKNVKKDVEEWTEQIKGLQQEINDILNNTEIDSETKQKQVSQLVQNTLNEATTAYNDAKIKFENDIATSTYTDYLKEQGKSEAYIKEYSQAYKEWYRERLNQADSYYQKYVDLVTKAYQDDGQISESELKEIQDIQKKYATAVEQLVNTSEKDITATLDEESLKRKEITSNYHKESLESAQQKYDKEREKMNDRYDKEKENITNNTVLSKKAKEEELKRIDEEQSHYAMLVAYQKDSLKKRAVNDEEYARKHNLTAESILDAELGIVSTVTDGSGNIVASYFDNTKALETWAEKNDFCIKKIKDSTGNYVEVAVNSNDEIMGSVNNVLDAYNLFADDINKYMKDYQEYVNNGQMTTTDAINKIKLDLEEGKVSAQDFGFSSDAEFVRVAKAILNAKGNTENLTAVLKTIPNNIKVNIETEIIGYEKLEHYDEMVEKLNRGWGYTVVGNPGMLPGQAEGGTSSGGIYNINEKGIELADSITSRAISLGTANYEQAYLPSGTKVSNALLTTMKMKSMIETEVNRQSKEMYSAIKDLATLMTNNKNSVDFNVTMNNPHFDNKGSENANVNNVKRIIKSMY